MKCIYSETFDKRQIVATSEVYQQFTLETKLSDKSRPSTPRPVPIKDNSENPRVQYYEGCILWLQIPIIVTISSVR